MWCISLERLLGNGTLKAAKPRIKGPSWSDLKTNNEKYTFDAPIQMPVKKIVTQYELKQTQPVTEFKWINKLNPDLIPT